MNKNRFLKLMPLALFSANVMLSLASPLIIGATEEPLVNQEPVIEAANNLQNGIYVLLTDLGTNGWSTYHSIEVEDGDVIHSTYDIVDEEGNSRLEDPEYRDAVDTLNNQFVEIDNPEVDIVTGAEQISHEFRVTAAMLLAMAEHGMHDGLIVSRLPLTDGEYVVNGVDNQTMTLVVENEEIVSVVIEGESVNQAAAEALVESLLNTQDIHSVEAPETADAETKAEFEYLALLALEAIGQVKIATIHEMAAEAAQ